ncbi:MAG: response regulator [Bacteroidales bacterium]|nr:response regulator [Bacteroidales bacterium]
MQKEKFTPLGLTKNELELKLWKTHRFNKLRETYLSYMQQNIRTQMNNINGFSKLLAEDEDNHEKRDAYFDQIEKSTEKLDRLVSETLNIAVMSLDEINVQTQPCFVNQLMDELYVYFSQQKKVYSKAYVELYLNQDVDFNDFAILTDCSRLRQIFAQLVGNCLANCSDGDEIEFGYKLLDEGKSGILFYVEDNATSYTKDDIAQILKQPELYLESSAHDLKMESVDFIVLKTLIDMLDGEADIITKDGKGIRYEFVLPYSPYESKENTMDKSVKEIMDLKKSFEWKGLKIMVAEDDDSNYTLLEEALSNTQATILRAENGKEAVKVFEDNPDINIILMDIKMPVMDGLEATEKIKKMNPDVPVIAQTAFVVDFDKEMAMKAGCDDYVSKPINFETLFKIMDLYLKNLV